MLEYTVLEFIGPFDYRAKQSLDELNEFAKDGWRLVSATETDYSLKLFLERKLKDKEPSDPLDSSTIVEYAGPDLPELKKGDRARVQTVDRLGGRVWITNLNQPFAGTFSDFVPIGHVKAVK